MENEKNVKLAKLLTLILIGIVCTCASIVIFGILNSLVCEGELNDDYNFSILRIAVLIISIIPFVAWEFLTKIVINEKIFKINRITFSILVIGGVIVGIFSATTWNQLWLYNGWPSAPGTRFWLNGYDGESSYNREFSLMLIWTQIINLGFGIHFYFRYKKNNKNNFDNLNET